MWPALISGARTLATALGGAQVANWLGLGGSSGSGSSMLPLAIVAVAAVVLVVVLRV